MTESLYVGSSIEAWLTDDMIVIAPTRGHSFESPIGTLELHLPFRRTISVRRLKGHDRDWTTLVFEGEYSSVGRPNEVLLSPVRMADARKLAEIVGARFEWPRLARTVLPRELAANAIAPNEYIRVIGQQSPHRVHFEAADFAGCKLEGDVVEPRKPGRWYAVTGFFTPAVDTRDPTKPRPVGYCGPRIAVTELQAEPPATKRTDVSPAATHDVTIATGMAHSSTHARNVYLAFNGSRDDGSRVVALLHGWGGQSTGDTAATVGRLVLATLLSEPGYGAWLDGSAEPGFDDSADLAREVAWLVERRPLPGGSALLVIELGLRIANVLDALNLRGADLHVDGVLCHLRGDVATVLVRGGARAYLVGATESQLLVGEDTVARGARAEGIDVDERMPWITTAAFDSRSLPIVPAEAQLGSDRRLLLCAGEPLLEALNGPGPVERLRTSLRDVTRLFPETAGMRDQGWGAILGGPVTRTFHPPLFMEAWIAIAGRCALPDLERCIRAVPNLGVERWRLGFEGAAAAWPPSERRQGDIEAADEDAGMFLEGPCGHIDVQKSDVPHSFRRFFRGEALVGCWQIRWRTHELAEDTTPERTRAMQGAMVALVRILITAGIPVEEAHVFRRASCFAPSPPLAPPEAVLLAVASAEIAAKYPDVTKYQRLWDDVTSHPSGLTVMSRALDAIDELEFKRRSYPRIWELARACRPGECFYPDPSVTPWERELFDGTPSVMLVGYDPAEESLEYSADIENGQHIPPKDIFTLRDARFSIIPSTGTAPKRIRVAFSDRAMAMREIVPLLDAGVEVVYFSEAGTWETAEV